MNAFKEIFENKDIELALTPKSKAQDAVLTITSNYFKMETGITNVGKWQKDRRGSYNEFIVSGVSKDEISDIIEQLKKYDTDFAKIKVKFY